MRWKPLVTVFWMKKKTDGNFRNFIWMFSWNKCASLQSTRLRCFDWMSAKRFSNLEVKFNEKLYARRDTYRFAWSFSWLINLDSQIIIGQRFAAEPFPPLGQSAGSIYLPTLFNKSQHEILFFRFWSLNLFNVQRPSFNKTIFNRNIWVELQYF